MRRSVAAFGLAFLAVTAVAQERKMHRIQAGEPDASGWVTATSTEGRFSVRMPLKYNDFTVTESKPDAPAARTFTVGARSSEKIAFVATRIEYRKGAASAKEYFARFEKGQGLGATPEKVAAAKVGSLRAVDLVLKRAADVSYQRVVLLDKDLLMLSVEAPREHDTTVQPLLPLFFDSLKADAK